MKSTFINNTIEFLTNSDLNIKLPEIRKVTLSDNGSNCTLNLYDSLSFNATKLNRNLIITNLIAFSLLDGFIDNKYPHLVGLSFKKKYDSLPYSTDIEIVTKETFRLMKLIRNTIVHNSDNITIHGTSYNFSYSMTQMNTPFNLDISHTTLSNLITIILIISKDSLDYANTTYFNGFLRVYYDDLRNDILLCGNLTDDITNKFSCLLDISTEIRIKRHVRYLVENPEYNIQGYDISITPYNPGLKEYGVDYKVKYNDSLYLIPSEALNSKNNILITELNKWILD